MSTSASITTSSSTSTTTTTAPSATAPVISTGSTLDSAEIAAQSCLPIPDNYDCYAELQQRLAVAVTAQTLATQQQDQAALASLETYLENVKPYIAQQCLAAADQALAYYTFSSDKLSTLLGQTARQSDARKAIVDRKLPANVKGNITPQLTITISW